MKNNGLLQNRATFKTNDSDILYIHYNAYTNLYEIWIDRGLNGRFNAFYSRLFLDLDTFPNFIKAYKFLRENKHAIY